MPKLVGPHGGGGLKALLAPRAERAEQLARARNLKKVPMTSREVSDVLMMAMGAYTPLDGFMDKRNWRRVCNDMKLMNGVFWPIPVTLSVSEEFANDLGDNAEIALVGALYEDVFNHKAFTGRSGGMRRNAGCMCRNHCRIASQTQMMRSIRGLR